MANPDEVAQKDGAHRTNVVAIESGAVLNSDYNCTVLENEIGATGRLKVLRLTPSSEQGAAPCFLGRWDEKDKALDFDLVDSEDNVLPVEVPGHHSTHLGDRRFEVEIRAPYAVTKLVFKGIVVVRLGFKMNAETGHYHLQ